MWHWLAVVLLPWLYAEFKIMNVLNRYYSLPEEETRGLFVQGPPEGEEWHDKRMVAKNWCSDCCHGFVPNKAGTFFDYAFGLTFGALAVLMAPMMAAFLILLLGCVIAGLIIFIFIILPIQYIAKCCSA